ncbi:MAG: hypothetical protein AAGF11_49875 [Myxococcota bacterium]
MLDLTTFVGTTSKPPGTPLKYEINGVILQKSSATFEEITSARLLLQGQFDYGPLNINGKLEIFGADEASQEITLGYSLDNSPFLTQRYKYEIPNTSRPRINFGPPVNAEIHRSKVEGPMLSLLTTLMSIERASLGVTEANNTELAATSTTGFSLSATLVPSG